MNSHHRFIAPSLASAAVLLTAIGLSRELLMHESPTAHFIPTRQRAAGELLKSPETSSPMGRLHDEFSDDVVESRSRLAANKPRTVTNGRLDESFDYRSTDEPLLGADKERQDNKELDRLRPDGSRGSDAEIKAAAKIAAAPSVLHAQRKLNNERFAESSVTARLAQKGLAEEAPVDEIRRNQARSKADLNDSDIEFSLLSNGLARREGDEAAQAMEMESGKNVTTGAKINEVEIPKMEVPGVAGGYAHAGFNFLDHYQQTQNLYFQPATGYWANTYIPGDPEIRLLSARLAQWDRSWLANNASLEQGVKPVNQPFDAPADNALALSLMADANSVTTNELAQGPTRMRLQVGIRGIEHRRGQRPAMNVGVVVDLPADAPDEVRIATRALLDAMLQSKQAGDRFSLVMTGSGLVVEAGDFRFGSLQLAKQLILGKESGPGLNGLDSNSFDLYEAMQRAGTMVQQTDDPSRPLGSSSVLLISAKSMPDIERLTALAHERAKEGITLSVFPLGGQPRIDNVEKLVLAGLGNRRYLETPGQARQAVEEELHASSRAIARAVRLSIRLAPGVRLIGVVGSERLDKQRAQRVRDIEHSMDRRLSANLGIQADRGEDEDGIQIVIPSIFSGDAVSVLLDVVTDRPGAIAEVSLRYKDLVFLRNGSLQGHLNLPGSQLSGSENKRGPAELTVLKNLLSHHFVDAVEQAAVALGRQQPADAIATLSAMRSTIDQARQSLPEWANDPDLIRDQQVLDRYIAALASPQAGSHQSFLADSLRYAAWAKTHRPLQEWKQ